MRKFKSFKQFKKERKEISDNTDIGFYVVYKTFTYQLKNNLSSKDVFKKFGISLYLLKNFIFDPWKTRTSVFKKILEGLGLKLMVE